MRIQGLRIALLSAISLAMLPGAVQAQNGEGYTYTGSAGVLFLFRENPNACPQVVDTDHNLVLGAEEFNFDVGTGIDTRLGVWFDDIHAIEARYFGIDNWSAGAWTSTTTGYWVGEEADAIGEDDVPVNEQINIHAHYTSELKSFEIYFISYEHPWLGISAGYRHIGLNEQLSIEFEQDIDLMIAGNHSGRTTNQLHGFKLDAHLLVWDGDWLRVGIEGEAGIYGNQASHSADYSGNAGTYWAGGTQNRTSFVGDMSFWTSILIAPWLECRVAYELLWIDGVALASDQLPQTNYINGTGINTSSSIFYHGLSIIGTARY